MPFIFCDTPGFATPQGRAFFSLDFSSLLFFKTKKENQNPKLFFVVVVVYIYDVRSKYIFLILILYSIYSSFGFRKRVK